MRDVMTFIRSLLFNRFFSALTLWSYAVCQALDASVIILLMVGVLTIVISAALQTEGR